MTDSPSASACGIQSNPRIPEITERDQIDHIKVKHEDEDDVDINLRV